jgi:peptide/nickel transport system permease protein
MNETLRHIRHVLSENPVTMLAFVMLAAIGPWLAPFDPLASNVGTPLTPPSAAHWFGTDALGRDILSRVMVATRLDLGIAVAAVGCPACWVGWPGRARATSAVGPTASSGASPTPSWPFRCSCWRWASSPRSAIRSPTSSSPRRSSTCPSTSASRAPRPPCGATRASSRRRAWPATATARLLFHHIIPNILPPIMVQISLNMGWAILNAAGLSFIGLGVRPPQAEWGIMVAEGAQYIVSGEWWIALVPRRRADARGVLLQPARRLLARSRRSPERRT